MWSARRTSRTDRVFLPFAPMKNAKALAISHAGAVIFSIEKGSGKRSFLFRVIVPNVGMTCGGLI